MQTNEQNVDQTNSNIALQIKPRLLIGKTLRPWPFSDILSYSFFIR